jgi:hypothetical protein
VENETEQFIFATRAWGGGVVSPQGSDTVVQEEWLQEQLQRSRAITRDIEFDRVERAWRLACHVALTVVTIAGLILALVHA